MIDDEKWIDDNVASALVASAMWTLLHVGPKQAREMRDEMVMEYMIAPSDWNEQCDRLADYQARNDRTLYAWDDLKIIRPERTTDATS